MCTSFAAYYGFPLYGMNFDFPKVDIKVKIQKVTAVKFICFYIYVFNHYSPLVGMNEYGDFVNLQELHLEDDVNQLEEYHATKQIDGLQLFFDYLNRRITIAEILATDCKTKLKLPANYKIHNLFATLDGQATIVEGIKGKLWQKKIAGQELIMTNFAHALYPYNTIPDLHWVGAERYIATSRLLKEKKHTFDINHAMDILQSTLQTKGDYPTQCSWVFDPTAQIVYFRRTEKMDNVWKISLQDETIEKIDDMQAPTIKIGPAGMVVSLLE
jgi:hypothetical protein